MSYTEAEIRDAVANAISLAGALRRLGLRRVGGNYKTLRRHIEHYGISTGHLDPNWTRRSHFAHPPKPLCEVLVEHSTYHRGKLKRRLYDAGLKARQCELCGQREVWRGQPMALIIDRIQRGRRRQSAREPEDRVPQLCGDPRHSLRRKNGILFESRRCLHCDIEFRPRYESHRYCSQQCGSRAGPGHAPQPERREVERPPFEQLMAALEVSNWSAVARKVRRVRQRGAQVGALV